MIDESALLRHYERYETDSRFGGAVVADELLEALRELGDWPLNSACYDGSPAKSAAESLANARRFARDAIAKAETA